MTDRIRLKNVSAVPLGLPNIGFRAPGEEFVVQSVGGEPIHYFWRKRLKEGAVSIVPAAKPASKSDSSEAAPSKKKG